MSTPNKKTKVAEDSASSQPQQQGKKSLQAIISASILDCNKLTWGDQLQQAMDAGSDWLHVDVMDGHFVPALSFGTSVVASLRTGFRDVFFDVHYMVDFPERFVEAQKASVGLPCGFTFHVEATEPRGMTNELIDKIRATGMRVGIALSPDTPVEAVLPYCGLVDLVLVMTVRPGLGGQSFMAEMLPKIKTIREKFPDLDIEVDGGIKAGDSSQKVAEAGANVLVSGSGVFMATDKAQAIKDMREKVVKVLG